MLLAETGTAVACKLAALYARQPKGCGVLALMIDPHVRTKPGRCCCLQGPVMMQGPSILILNITCSTAAASNEGCIVQK
jgi:hypothetical protein